MEGVNNPLRALYNWVLSWSRTPYGSWALFGVAFFESSLFPVPPDVLLFALALSLPARSFYYALICSVGSVLGGIFGYLIGRFLFETIGIGILNFYHAMDKYLYLQDLYRSYDLLIVWIAGFTPLPYKVFTISAGAFRIDFATFLVASILSRSARFFLLSGIVYLYGERMRGFIEKYFNLLTLAITLLLVGGLFALRFME